jgi:hypothetical protein
MRPACLLALVLLAFIPRAARPQGDPLGPEFRVNTFTTNDQRSPSVAADSGGNFVVVWDSNLQDGSGHGVFGQRYSAAGVPLGPEFRVNSFTTGSQGGPAVASDAAGNFFVAWYTSGGVGDVFGQRYASSGAPLGAEFRVNTYTLSAQTHPAIAVDGAGNFVVAWQGFTQVGPGYEVFGQRFSSSGAPVGPEFQINTYTTGAEWYPSVAADGAGNFIVVWQGDNQVIGQRYASTGAPLGGEFQINTTGQGSRPSVAADVAGNFVVVWYADGPGDPNLGVFGRRYASDGTPLGPEFLVNTYTTGYQWGARVGADASGNFVVVWHSYPQDGPTSGVFGQRYAASGAPSGPEFRVNTYTTGHQAYPAVAVDGAGNFVVAWTSQNQDGSNDGVFGQRYSQIVPVELMHFKVE